MERGSHKHGSKLDEQIKKEVEPLERATHQESHVEGDREKEDRPDHTQSAQEGDALSGSGSSADDFPYRDRGEEGGVGHPKP
jgi:hypothetical protein